MVPRSSKASPPWEPPPQNARANKEQKENYDPERCVPTLSSLFPSKHRKGHKTDKISHIHHTIQYRKHEAHRRRHPADTETRKSDFQRAPRGGGRTPPPPPCAGDTRNANTKAQQAIAIASASAFCYQYIWLATSPQDHTCHHHCPNFNLSLIFQEQTPTAILASTMEDATVIPGAVEAIVHHLRQ